MAFELKPERVPSITVHPLGRMILACTLSGVVAVEHPSMQTRTAADGPWAGWAQCELTAQFTGAGQTYLNQQTHTWTLIGSTPTSGTDIKVYLATWTVTGSGSSLRLESNGRTVTEKWSTAGEPMSDSITFRLDNAGVLHIASREQLRSAGATTGVRVAFSTNGNAPNQATPLSPGYVDEWAFPLIQDVATKTTISRALPPSAVGSIAPGQPAGTTSTATCSWHFIRGGPAPPPPPPRSMSQQTVSKPGGPAPSSAMSSISPPVAPPGRPAGSPPPTRTSPVASGRGTGTNAQPPSSDLPSMKTGSAPTNVLYLLKTVQKEGRACVVQIGVRWDSVPDATDYTVYVSDSANGAYQAATSGVIVPAWSTRRRIEFDAVDPGRASAFYVRIGASFDRMREGITGTRAIPYSCLSSSSGWRQLK